MEESTWEQSANTMADAMETVIHGYIWSDSYLVQVLICGLGDGGVPE